MNYYKKVWQNYAVFQGRARRTEYWMFVLWNLVAMAVLTVVDGVAGTEPVLTTIYALAVMIPAIAVGVRRLHDTGRTGWWMLISLVPFVGAIVLIVMFALPGTPGSNAYGTNPKEVRVADTIEEPKV